MANQITRLSEKNSMVLPPSLGGVAIDQMTGQITRRRPKSQGCPDPGGGLGGGQRLKIKTPAFFRRVSFIHYSDPVVIHRLAAT
jgi:hypothetical protein